MLGLVSTTDKSELKLNEVAAKECYGQVKEDTARGGSRCDAVFPCVPVCSIQVDLGELQRRVLLG